MSKSINKTIILMTPYLFGFKFGQSNLKLRKINTLYKGKTNYFKRLKDLIEESQYLKGKLFDSCKRLGTKLNFLLKKKIKDHVYIFSQKFKIF